MNRALRMFILFSLVTILFVLTFMGAIAYKGNTSLYIVFSIVCNIQLLSSFKKSTTYTYPIVSTMFWIGFWLKITLHLIFNYPYQEPIGEFDFSSISYDRVLVVILYAIAGLLFAGKLSLLAKKTGLIGFNELKSKCHRNTLSRWLKILGPSCAIVTGIIAVLNTKLGIQQTGLIASVKLPFHLSTIISWFLSNGFIMFIYALVFWDEKREQRKIWYFVLIIFEGFISSISLMSRSILFFHVLPIFALFIIGKGSNLHSRGKQRVFILVVSILCFIGSIGVVTTLRRSSYSDSTNKSTANITDTFTEIAHLAVDRWIGAEGVMAVSSYQDKGIDLLIRGTLERRREGEIDLYQNICLSVYRFSDTNKYVFGSLPGIVAFFYYSGSWIIVFIGMFVISFFAFSLEWLVARSVMNPFIVIWYAFNISMQVVQMGIDPYRQLISIVMTLLGIAIIGIIQRIGEQHSGRKVLNWSSI